MVVRKEVWITPPKHGYAVFGEAGYVSVSQPTMMRSWSIENKSDRAESSILETSDDNGRTWGKKRLVSVLTKKGGFTKLGGREGGVPFLDSDNEIALLFSLEVVLEEEDVVSGLKRRRIFYSISHDDGKTFSTGKQLIEGGTGYDAFHYARGVYYGLNSASIAGKPMKLSKNEVLLPTYVAPIDDNGELYNPLGGYTFSYASFMIGSWNSDFSDLEWESGEIVKIDPKLSNRGLSEIAVARLADGTILAICRGSNSHKWMTTSNDNARNWSDVRPLRFDDGADLFSPSSYSVLIKHSQGPLYWIANIVSTHPTGKSPRYPLCIAEIEERHVSVKRDTVTVIDTRQEGENEALQLSNFGAYEDRETGEIAVTCPRLFPISTDDWTAPCIKYSISR